MHACNEWAKRTKLLLEVRYRSPRRHSNSSRTFKKIGKNWKKFMIILVPAGSFKTRNRPDPTQPGHTRPDPTRPDPARPGQTRADLSQANRDTLLQIISIQLHYLLHYLRHNYLFDCVESWFELVISCIVSNYHDSTIFFFLGKFSSAYREKKLPTLSKKKSPSLSN